MRISLSLHIYIYIYMHIYRGLLSISPSLLPMGPIYGAATPYLWGVIYGAISPRYGVGRVLLMGLRRLTYGDLWGSHGCGLGPMGL